MKWYDIFANFYDNSLEKLYLSSRKRAIEILELKPHQNILDIACGTGANFKHIKNAQPSVKIFGTDFSEGMLRKCKNNYLYSMTVLSSKYLQSLTSTEFSPYF